jgi:uncharacterized protein (TIGR02147 family)
MTQVQSICASDFRTFLEQELTRRNSLNPNYSLRAFARDLGVDSSFLSKLLNGKRSMTSRTIMSLAPRLALPELEIQEYIQKANGRRRRYSMASFEAEVIKEVENQKLTQSMEWYHLAILELVNVSGFQANATWIADRLGITANDAQAALDDLMSASVLSQSEDGLWKNEIKNHFISAKKSPRVQMVKKQIYQQALNLLPEDVGDHSTMTVSVSAGRLAEASDRIARFRLDLCNFLTEPETKDQVYQLVISLFPVSK